MSNLLPLRTYGRCSGCKRTWDVPRSHNLGVCPQCGNERIEISDVPFCVDPPSKRALEKQVGGDHYKADVIQHVEFCQKNKMTWCESAALKYLMRHRKKNGRQDIEKAIHYLELLLEIEYPEPIVTPSVAKT